MARINLLPWREERRKEQQKEFVTGLGIMALVALGAFGAWHLYVAGKIDNQNSRNAYLEREIAEVDAKIKEIKELETRKEQLIARMKVIEQLQKNRPEIVHVLDELVRAVPDGLHLTGLKQVGMQFTMQGIARSNGDVSTFLRNLEASEWFDVPALQVIQLDGKGAEKAVKESRTFTLTVQQTQQQPNKDAADATKTTKGKR